MQVIEKVKTKLMTWVSQLAKRIIALIKKIDLVKTYAFCMKHKKRIILGLIVLYGLNYAYNYFFPDTGKKAPPQLVTTTLVEKKDLTSFIDKMHTYYTKEREPGQQLWVTDDLDRYLFAT